MTTLEKSIISRELEDDNQGLLAGEEVKSSYTYPPGYEGPSPIEKQAEVILKHFPKFDPEPTFRWFHDVGSKLVLPKWIEGPFLAPNEYRLAELFYPQIDGRLERYCAGVNLILEKIASMGRSFCNHRKGLIVSDRFQRTQRTAEMIDCLIEMQGGADILVHFAQLGLKYRGRSVHEGEKLYCKQEYGEGSLEVGSIFLVHPERLVCWNELGMDCAGDRFLPDGVSEFCSAPFFDFSVNVRFSTMRIFMRDCYYGSVSGFLPEC